MAQDDRRPDSETSRRLIDEALRRITHGTVTIVVQDGRVVQIDTTEKRRLASRAEVRPGR